RTEFLAAATAAVCVGGACRFLGLQAFDDFGRYGLADEVFNAAHFVAFGMRGQGVGQSAASGAAGTANTVDVVFGLHGQVVIDGVADALHVDTAGGHIGGNQNAQLAFLQHAQGTGALTLVHVTMQGSGGKALVSQAVGQIVGATLG